MTRAAAAQRSRSWLVVLGALLGAALVPASARAAPILLPSVRSPLTPGPPLPGSSTATAETRVPPGTTSDERVLVGIEAGGKPVSVVVVQRLKLHQLGDYTFAVPGPIADVASAPGSDSEPGLRSDAIVWAGFSPGKKTLASRATLRLSAASLLPLRVTLTHDGDTLVVRGENVSGTTGIGLAGPVSAKDAAVALDTTRQSFALGTAAPDIFVDVPQNPVSHQLRIVAPLEIRGVAGGKRFAYRLGDGGPLSFELRVPHAGAHAKLTLTAVPAAPTRLLTPPAGTRTWVEALRRGRLARAGLLVRVSRARLTVARELEYQAYLTNPDPRGASRTVYVYSAAAKQTAVTPPGHVGSGGSGPWRPLVIAIVAVLATGGLVVLWAHS